MATYKRAADRGELDLRMITCLEFGDTLFAQDLQLLNKSIETEDNIDTLESM